MPALYAVRLIFADGNESLAECQSQDEARQMCTNIMEGEHIGEFTSRPARVSMLVRDAGEFRAVWSKNL